MKNPLLRILQRYAETMLAVQARIDRRSSDELQKKLAEHEYGYGKLGLTVGLICVLGGIALFLNGIAGSTSWTAKVIGAESEISDAAPGAVLFVVGVFIVFITRPKFEHSHTLRLTVNRLKSAVDRPMNRKFLGFTVSRTGAKLKVADKAIEKLKVRVRELTRRTRGTSIGAVVAELRQTLLGWKAYFGITEVLSPLRDIDKWIRRKLRC